MFLNPQLKMTLIRRFQNFFREKHENFVVVLFSSFLKFKKCFILSISSIVSEAKCKRHWMPKPFIKIINFKLGKSQYLDIFDRLKCEKGQYTEANMTLD